MSARRSTGRSSSLSYMVDNTLFTFVHNFGYGSKEGSRQAAKRFVKTSEYQKITVPLKADRKVYYYAVEKVDGRYKFTLNG